MSAGVGVVEFGDLEGGDAVGMEFDAVAWLHSGWTLLGGELDGELDGI